LFRRVLVEALLNIQAPGRRVLRDSMSCTRNGDYYKSKKAESGRTFHGILQDDALGLGCHVSGRFCPGTPIKNSESAKENALPESR
jgi:hypothetical protein